MPRNAVTQRGYSGVNVLLPWREAQQIDYGDAQWLTYKQAREAGGQVRKGEKGSRIVFPREDV
jgi:antirestriction protein ArdC